MKINMITNRSAILLGLIFLFMIPLSAQEERKDALKLYRQGKYADSVEVCLEELAAYGDNQITPRMDSYTVLGWAFIRLGRYEDAVSYSKDALKWSRYDARVIETLGEANFFLGNYQAGLNYFQQYVALNPTGDRIGQVYSYMGEIYIRMGQYHHADIALTTALYHVPSIAQWWARLGYAREGTGNSVSAVEAYSKALSLQPSLQEAKKGLDRVRGTES